ncbi:MAG TPA: ABC transporter permease [Pyrinomonadaceae bacterium]|jgi:putative ABC transport system permease protein|nr:ABC transporter permease [Pyrinomonadaceae bacterium]
MTKDLLHSIRSLLRHPGFTAVAVITLMLAIGVNTTIFSVVNAVLLKALPFRDPQQLVSVHQTSSPNDLPGIAAYQYLAWKEKSTTFEDLAAFSDDNITLTGIGEPERIPCAEVTASLFTTLGVQPVRGRFFVPEEDKPGANNVVVISEGFWQRRYGRDEKILQQALTLDNKPYSIVGVMPNGFRFPGEFDLWVPMALDPYRETHGDFFALVEVVGRLKTNATLAGAQAELGLIAKQASHQGKEQGKEPLPLAPVEVAPLHKQLIAGVRTTVLVLWGAVGLVMLLACVNVASLMVSRTFARQREIAVRAAVGARRWQLIRQLLTESIVIGLVGGGLGLLMAVWGTRAIASLVPRGFTTSVYDLNNIRLDWRVFAFTFGLSILTGIVFGLAPALTASKPDLIQALRNSRSQGLMSFGLRSFRGWLVVAELALAVVLLLAAGLLVRSFNKLLAIDLGFDRENVLTARISLPRSSYKEPGQTQAFYDNLLQRLQSTPGVQSAGMITHTPLAGFGLIAFMGIEGHAEPDRKTDPPIGIAAVSAEYFETMKIPLLSGRHYDGRDRADGQKVAIVNQAFTNRYFPNGDALGKRVSFGCEESEGLCRTIVGVVGNIRQESITDTATPEIYLPFPQYPMNGMTLMVRTTSDPLSIARSLRSEVLAIDKNQPLHDVRTLAQRVDEAVAVSRSLMVLFSAFALLALILGSVGIYGIVSYSVTQRTHEIGIRMALGARAGNVLSLIMKNGFVLVLTGVVIGVGGALMLTRFLATLLFGVTPTDALTFVAVSAVFFVIAMVASLIPALRATRVDPLIALRYE